MSDFIPLSVPNLKGNELKYITDAIEQEWVSTGGAYIDRFENDTQSYLNIGHAVACQSGTAGLHLALILSNVTSGDEVIVPALTFIAAVNPVRYVGAEPVFMDCDDFLCMDMDKVADFCAEECTFVDNKLINKTTKKHIKAMIVVHVFGSLTDMNKALKIAKDYNLTLIEDATEALGTYYTDGELKGMFAGTIGNIGVYSFNGNKIITTGGGGMLVTKDPAIAKKAKYLSTQAKDDEVNFVHNEIGYNYRMTNVQAALGVAQLERLEHFIDVKSTNYKRYKSELDKIDGFSVLDFRDDIRPNYWFYSLFIENANKQDLISYLGNHKIQTRPVWGLINEQMPYIACQSYKVENAGRYFAGIINIPCSTNLSSEAVDFVIEKIREFARG